LINRQRNPALAGAADFDPALAVDEQQLSRVLKTLALSQMAMSSWMPSRLSG
jgi:hypothetical protein